MQQNPPSEVSCCFSTVLLFLLVPKYGDPLEKKKHKKATRQTPFLQKEKSIPNSKQINSKQNVSKGKESTYVILSKKGNINIY